MSDTGFLPVYPGRYNALGIDPGSHLTGYCCLQIDEATKAIADALGWTADAQRLPAYDPYNSDLYPDKYARIIAHSKHLSFLLDLYNPEFVVCESPFYNPRRPNAYGVLVEVVTAVQRTVHAWKPTTAVVFVAPSVVKKAFNAKGTKKEHMLEAFQNLPQLHFPGTAKLDEHSIDAGAVVYAEYLNRLAAKTLP